MKTLWRHMVVVVGLAAMTFVVVGCQQQTRPRSSGSAVKGLTRIHFDFDQSAVKSQYKANLQGNAAWMKKHSRSNVIIEGHCDERGSSEYNIALGWRRARSAKNYLVSSGVSSKRLTTKSYGEERPLCSQSNESCWWKNRRAEFVKR